MPKTNEFRRKLIIRVRKDLDELNKSMFSSGLISGLYSDAIFDNISEDVADDIIAADDKDNYNDDDVRLAVGRVLCRRLGIEV